MRPPPPLVEPPARLAWLAVSGVAIIVLGLFSEFGFRPKPLVPATYVPGFLLLCVGGSVAAAVGERYLPKYGNLIYGLPAVIIFYNQTIGRNSALPLLLYAGCYQIIKALLRIAPFEPD